METFKPMMTTSHIFLHQLKQRFHHCKMSSQSRTLEILDDCFGECAVINGNIVTITCTDKVYEFMFELNDNLYIEEICII